jgi:hypothetical protein
MFYNLFFKNVSKQKSIFNYKKKNKIAMVHYNSFKKLNLTIAAQEIYFFFINLLKYLINKQKNNTIFNFINQFLFKNIIFNSIKLNIYFLNILLCNTFFYCVNKKMSIFLLTFSNSNAINLSFIFYKWVLLELNKKNKLNIINLPNKLTKYTLLRSPFVFKKGREQFEQHQIKLTINYSVFFTKNYFNLFNKKMKNSFFIKHKYTNSLD